MSASYQQLSSLSSSSFTTKKLKMMDPNDGGSYSSTIQRVWFQLVDENGKKCKGTTQTSIRLNPNNIIDDFRKAVKHEYSDSHVKGIASSDLKIYKNLASFMAKEAPIKQSSMVEGLGLDEDKNVLVVVVPGDTSVEKDFPPI